MAPTTVQLINKLETKYREAFCPSYFTHTVWHFLYTKGLVFKYSPVYNYGNVMIFILCTKQKKNKEGIS
ncbi:hypothetical protein XELAEV_18031195mg [Xenopus laevis]|uniref:Uncharacterized protein n=1 Tax=Xenopus laevis TaxID=8355 RepID=A0A974HFH8_XENLA|nr:hypothetical protein XELAEV_18031195mg [Xenopus laevis]